MRGRYAFALTALTLLFLLQGLSALQASLYASVEAVLTSRAAPWVLLAGVLPVLALLAPAVPLAHWLDRRAAIAGTALLTAVLRVPLSLPHHEARLVVSALVVAAGAAFLSLAVGFLERRSIAGGVGAAVVLDQLLRLAGWGWDLSLRPWWLWAQMPLALLVCILAVGWLRTPMQEAAELRPSYERRAGGLRLRGALALGLLLFLDMNVLARPELASRWLDVPYEAAAVLLVAAGMTATLLLLAGHGPIGRHRPAALALSVLATTAALGSGAAGELLGGWVGLALFAVGHLAVLLLVGRALVPAGGRRAGGALAAGLVCWLLFSAMLAAAWVAPPDATGSGLPSWLFAAAGVMLAVLLLLLPRPIQTTPPMRGRLLAALAMLLALAVAASLALRPPPTAPDTTAGPALRVAIIEARQGFDALLRHDPSALAAAARAADADVTILHDAGLLPTAYGIDLAVYLGRNLGVPAYAASSRNRLTGHTVLARVPAVPITLQTSDATSTDPFHGLVLPAGRDTLLLMVSPASRSIASLARTAPGAVQQSVFDVLAGARPHVLMVGASIVSRGVDLRWMQPTEDVGFVIRVVDVVLTGDGEPAH